MFAEILKFRGPLPNP